MIETPVNRLIPRLAVPTIISMLVTSIYNMADTFFVSQLSTSASGAVGVMFSAMSMIQAIGFTLGMGSGNHISRSLGNRDEERAGVFAATAFYTAAIIGVGILAVGTLFSRQLVFSWSHGNHCSLCSGLCKIYSDWGAVYDDLLCYE